jgi:hypothetical protein
MRESCRFYGRRDEFLLPAFGAVGLRNHFEDLMTRRVERVERGDGEVRGAEENQSQFFIPTRLPG